jgi:5-methylcytosine-specific restriction endonuclease McrA
MDMWKYIPTSRLAANGLDTLRHDELNTMVLLCGYQELLFESISTDDIRIKTFTDTVPQDAVYTADLILLCGRCLVRSEDRDITADKREFCNSRL